MDLDLDALEALEREATPGEWEWQTGCSWRRIGTNGDSGNVLCPTNNRYDRHPDLNCREEDGEFIVTLRNHARALIAEARRARELEAYTYHRGQCDYFYSHPVTAERPCSCGLSALLRKDGERG